MGAPSDLFAPFGEPAGVPVAGRRQLAGFAETVERELTDRVEQAVAARFVVELHQRLVDEASDDVEYRDRFDHIVGGDRLGSVEREPGLEHTQSTKHSPLDIGQRIDTPRDRSEQGLLAGQHGAGASGEQPERVGKAERESVEWQ